MSEIHRRGPAQIHANLTPMIDVTFLLIVFFVLVSQIVEVENVELALPELADPATMLPGDEQRSVINVVPAFSGGASEVRVGGASFAAGDEGVEALTRHLAGLLAANPSLRLNLRADQHTQYEWVQPVLQAVSGAAARVDDPAARARINLVVLRED
ncbi:MAG: biopolymer transporter ExbD [Planctomycetes bacterium]|nr:biopolymer transporter ExbD [Planctomycetota bacterium]